MKHIIIIPDGGGDKPLEQLGGKTAFRGRRRRRIWMRSPPVGAEVGVAKTTRALRRDRTCARCRCLGTDRRCITRGERRWRRRRWD